MNIGSVARSRFYAYTGILVLVAIFVRTPDPVPFLMISGTIISLCEAAFWLFRAFGQRRGR